MMSFRKSAQAAQAVEDAAAVVRLDAIASRGRIEGSDYPETPPERPRVQRRFWTPEEIAASVPDTQI